jgi:hypothetical protein
MRLPKAGWHDQLRDLAAEAELENSAFVVHRDNGVERCVENGEGVRLSLAQRRALVAWPSTLPDHRVLTIVPQRGATYPPLGTPFERG